MQKALFVLFLFDFCRNHASGTWWGDVICANVPSTFWC